jgi:predicted ATPase
VLLGDRFELGPIVGRGALGVVHRAIDTATGEAVAVKMLMHTDGRFPREWALLREISHPAVVRYLSHGTSVHGKPYLVMEWLEGETLEARLERDRRLSLGDALALAIRLAEALASVHARKAVHRDVKPANVHLVNGRLDRAKLLDFGLARTIGEAEHQQTVTATGQVLGTVGYMAPEQARGGHIDARGDVFSLGCLLFRCLSGTTPFAGQSALAVLLETSLAQHISVDVALANAPQPLRRLIDRMLSGAPRDRPVDGAAAAAELEAVQRSIELAAGDAVTSAMRLTGSERWVASLVLLRDPHANVDPARADGRLSEVGAVVSGSGGRLYRLADGTLSALFIGDGTAHDLATRAARCALRLREQIHHASVALASGRAVAGASIDPGELVGVAASLLAQAAYGEILTDDATAQRLGNRFVLAPRGELRSLEAEQMPMPGRLLPSSTAFVGREQDLFSLESAFDEALSERSARGVLVTARPGVGKTRLLEEALRRVQRKRPDVEVWVGIGDPIRSTSAFGVLAEALRTAASIARTDAAGVQRRKLDTLAARSLRGEALGRATAFLGELLGVGSASSNREIQSARRDPALMGDQIRSAFISLAAARARAGPLVLVLDDLHWADAPSLELARRLLDPAQDAPMLLLCAARPELAERAPSFVSAGRLWCLALANLPPRASGELVRASLGRLANDALCAELHARADGNPFYLEQLVRAVEEGRGREFPASVVDAAQERIDALAPSLRRVARAASVFGDVFDESGIAALLEGVSSATDVAQCLEELCERDVLIPVGQPDAELLQSRSTGRELGFRHPLLREAAYATITADDLRTAHRRAGSWLEPRLEAQPAVLANHFELGGLPELASAWYRRAGEHALDGGDLEVAVELAQRGLRAGATGSELGRLHLTLARAHAYRGDQRLRAEHAELAVSALETGSVEWCLAMGELSGSSAVHEASDDLVRVARELMALTVTAEIAAVWMRCAAITASLLYTRAEHSLGLALIDGMQQVTPLFDDPAVSARLHQALAMRWMADAPALAMRHRAAFIESIEAIGDVRTGALARINLAFIQVQMGQHEAAEAGVRQAIDVCNRLEFRGYVEALALGNLGLALGAQGKIEEALTMHLRAVAAAAVLGDRRLEGLSRAYLAGALAALGELSAAEGEAQTAIAAVGSHAPARAFALATLADILLASQKPDDALREALEAHRILQETGSIIEGDLFVRAVLADALSARGDHDRARAMLTEARQRLDERAQAIDDAELRASYLERVAENRRILERTR